jgi:hypothetical protein
MVRDVDILSWFLIAVQIVVPLPVGLLAAWLFWRRRSWIIGNVVGSGVILLATVVCFGNQFVDGLRLGVACDEDGLICVTHPNLFMSLATFVAIGFAEIAILYLAGAKVEERAAHRALWQQLESSRRTA